MKIFLFSFILTILISGCTTKNAFSKLEMSKDQEKAVENTRSAKMIEGENIGGIFSAIYLNNIYKNINKESKLFYISIFMKEKNSSINATLNNNKAIHSEKLPHTNKYSHLLPITNTWTQNYLVTFTDTQSKDINLSIDSGPFSSGLLSFQEDLQ